MRNLKVRDSSIDHSMMTLRPVMGRRFIKGNYTNVTACGKSYKGEAHQNEFGVLVWLTECKG